MYNIYNIFENEKKQVSLMGFTPLPNPPIFFFSDFLFIYQSYSYKKIGGKKGKM
jgi:hypothetical protein